MIDFCNKTNYLIVGRGATAIFLVLKAHFLKKKVLLPANICYAAVYPVLYSDNMPVFCDVDIHSGNVTLDDVKPYVNDVSAMIIPHMYGNPNNDIRVIANLCKKHNILLIEDCASAMGAQINDTIVGSYGDYSVFSTGYSKTIDVGNGGLLASNSSLNLEQEIYEKLNEYSQEIHEKNQWFSKCYRHFRNSGENIISSSFFDVVNEDLSGNYLYRIDSSFEKILLARINQLPTVIEERRYKLELYNQYLRFDHKLISDYAFSEKAVPWRKNIMVNPVCKTNLVNHLLEKQIPVSDWYPDVSSLFGDDGVYPSVKYMEKQILNFPLLIPDSEIEYISKTINSYLMCMKESE